MAGQEISRPIENFRLVKQSIYIDCVICIKLKLIAHLLLLGIR